MKGKCVLSAAAALAAGTALGLAGVQLRQEHARLGERVLALPRPGRVGLPSPDGQGRVQPARVSQPGFRSEAQHLLFIRIDEPLLLPPAPLHSLQAPFRAPPRTDRLPIHHHENRVCV